MTKKGFFQQAGEFLDRQAEAITFSVSGAAESASATFNDAADAIGKVIPKQAKEPVKAASSAAAGMVAGHAVIATTGITAAGMVGGGAGFGAAAGPVGIVAGAVTGLAAYGVYKAFSPSTDQKPAAEKTEE